MHQSVIQAGEKTKLINEVRMNILGMRFAERGILLFTEAHGPAKVEINKQAFVNAHDTLQAKLREVRPLLESARGRELADIIESSMEEYARTQSQVPVLCASGRVDEAMRIDM